MPSDNKSSTSKMPAWIAKILAMPNESVQKTLFVALTMCLVCSVMVASATVLLRPIRPSTKRWIERKTSWMPPVCGKRTSVSTNSLSAWKTGSWILPAANTPNAVDPATYDEREAVKNPALSQKVPADQDIARSNASPSMSLSIWSRKATRSRPLSCRFKAMGCGRRCTDSSPWKMTPIPSPG